MIFDACPTGIVIGLVIRKALRREGLIVGLDVESPTGRNVGGVTWLRVGLRCRAGSRPAEGLKVGGKPSTKLGPFSSTGVITVIGISSSRSSVPLEMTEHVSELMHVTAVKTVIGISKLIRS